MEKINQDPKSGTGEHFLEVTRLQRWGTIQEYVDLCRAREYFTEAFYRKAVAHMECIQVRRMLRQVTNGRGWPARVRVHARGAVQPRGVPAGRRLPLKAQTYREHAKARFSVKLPLFDEDNGEMGTP